jgi:3-deoxy-D-manno-octulosonic-acid transferase
MTSPLADEASRSQSRFGEGEKWFALYDALLPMAIGVARLSALFHPKLREALAGRRGGVNRWQIGPSDDRPALLVHTASRGEFEGAQPMLERLLTGGRYRLAVSFSSPSVRGSVTALNGLWARGYLPLDKLDEQLKLLTVLKPRALVIFKHDFWPNMLRAARMLKVPVLIANANFHTHSRRNLPVIRSFHRTFMKGITAVLTVSKDDAHRAADFLNPDTELKTLGDTRYDRVMQQVELGRTRFAFLREALGSAPVAIVGSSWQPEEKICWQTFTRLHPDFPDFRMVVVPHEPHPGAIKRNRELAAQYRLNITLFSEWKQGQAIAEVLLVDRVGMLAELYAVGWAAFVGGGFGAGIHSVLEPAAHGLPVAFGPRHHVSHEAGLLLDAGGGFIVRDADELERLWRDWLGNRDSYRRAANAARVVVTSRAGATDHLMAALETHLASR